MADEGENDIEVDYASMINIHDEVQQLGLLARSRPNSSSVLYAGRGGPPRADGCILPGTLIEQRKRRETFFKYNWPLKKPDPDQLSEAGFFYEGNGDTVKCLYCDVTVRNWEENDEPLVEHKRFSPKCLFVKQF